MIISQNVTIVLLIHYRNESDYQKDIKKLKNVLPDNVVIPTKNDVMCEKNYHNDPNYIVTTGLRLLMLLREFNYDRADINVCGFDNLNDTSNLHYFEKCSRRDMNIPEKGKHSTDLEKKIYQRFRDSGFITHLS